MRADNPDCIKHIISQLEYLIPKYGADRHCNIIHVDGDVRVVLMEPKPFLVSRTLGDALKQYCSYARVGSELLEAV